MNISIFDLFSIGIGPSSSHTVGPMQAAYEYTQLLEGDDLLKKTDRILVELYGSLALTGKGHGTEQAIINGLAGYLPDSVDPDSMLPRLEKIISSQSLSLLNKHHIHFEMEKDFLSHRETFLPKHSNALAFSAFAKNGDLLKKQIYYSIGGGFIVTEENYGNETAGDQTSLPYPFSTASELLQLCRDNNLTISELMLANEKMWRDERTIRQEILNIVNIMEKCIDKGCQTKGELPGGLQVKRRAADLYHKLQHHKGVISELEHTDVMNYLNVFAIAVNEENAAGGRIVTAPTNGAAGIIPAVLNYYTRFHDNSNEQGVIDFMLTAGAIAILYKKGASISGAEVGCQGEVGVASSMAAGALTAVLGGSLAQIENAAEIAMEHHLGMTCDPVAGLVQIPCIERNAMGSVKAVNAARLALMGEGDYKISLDKVIATMLRTGRDMMTIYKETSLGGLAVNIIEC